MEILNVGPAELFFIIVLMLVILGPRDMVKVGRQIGLFIRKMIQSPAWQTMMSASREIREMPTRLIRDTGLEEDLQEIKSNTQAGLGLDPLDLREIKSSFAQSIRVDLPKQDATPEPNPTETAPLPDPEPLPSDPPKEE